MVTVIETCWKCGLVHYVGLDSEQHKLHLCRKCYEETPEYELSVKKIRGETYQSIESDKGGSR